VLFLDAEKAARALEIARKQVDAVQKMADGVSAQVNEGRLLPIELKRVQLSLAIARQRTQALETDLSFAENSLAVIIGMQPLDRARAADENRGAPMLPLDEEEAVSGALQTNRELRRLQSAIAAKTLEAKANRAERLPTVDLVAQYGLFAKFNHYEDYFRAFQRNNGQLGVSFRVPLYASHAATAMAAQADVEVSRIRLQIQGIRNQVSLDTRKSFQEVRKAETSAEVARLALDLAREQVSVNLARMEEGRATLGQVEESRFNENEKWLEWLDSRYALERARYALLRESGDLVAALR
jgi:outer membrane protein